MVKADINRDYYADLDLPPTADINDIKKQFKKLALIYHPDRNPGKEAEVTTKFQRIQSAHEVLTDVHEKARYDAVRARSKSFASSAYTSHARGNSYANAGSQWPPPQKAPTARKPTGPPPSHGAQKYRNFETPKSSAYNQPQEGPEARADMYTAWEKMKPKPAPSQSWQRFQSQGPTAAQAFGTRRAERARQNQSRDYTPKYTPDDSSYRKYSVPKDRDSFDYSGESSSPRGNPPRRSRSTGAPRRNGFMPSDPEGDEPPATNTSAYRRANPPPTSTPGDFSNFRSSRSSKPMVDPLQQFREQSDNPCEPRLSTPYATHGGEKTNPFDFLDLGRSKSTREPPTAFATTQKSSSTADIPRTSSDPNLASKNRNGASRPTAAGKARQQARPAAATDADSEDSDYIPRNKPAYKPPSEENREKFLSSEARKAAAAMANAKVRHSMASAPTGETTNTGPADVKEDDSTRIFDFNLDDDIFTTTKAQDKKPTSTGTENVGSTFSPKDWDGKFDDAGFFTPEQGTEYGKARPGLKSRGRSPPKPRAGETRFQATREMPTAATESSTSQDSTSQDWAQYFKPPTFMPPQQAKPKIARSAVRRPKAPRSNSAVVDDNDDEDSSDGPPRFEAPNTPGRTRFSVNGAKNGASVDADSPDAMDIDSPPAIKTPVPAASDAPVTPTVGMMPSNRPTSPVPAPPNRSEESKSKQSAPPTTNGDDMKINLDSLKQTEPIKQPTPSGLNSFDDLFASLPFESRASLIHPAAESFIPKAPLAPLTLTQATYAGYVAEFKIYMNQWGILNSRLVLHFAARKKQTTQFVNDLENLSEGLWNSYLEGIHEDQKLRTTWNEATKDHEVALKHFQSVQLKAKGLGLGETAN